MSKPWIKKIAGPLGVLLVVLMLLVAADYHGWLGSEEKTVTEFVEFRIEVTDEQTGTPVTGVNVRCFQMETRKACGQPPSRIPGIVRVELVTHKDVRRTRLFEHVLRIHEALNPELKIMFIHPDYHTPTEFYQIPELMAAPDKLRRMTLQRRPPRTEDTADMSDAALMEEASEQ